jgi:hypothetical protein
MNSILVPPVINPDPIRPAIVIRISRKVLVSASILTLTVIALLSVGMSRRSSPVESIRKLALAAEHHDKTEVLNYIDADKLAVSLKETIHALHAKEAAAGSDNDILSAISSSVQGLIVDTMADSFITPATIPDLLCGEVQGSMKKTADAQVDNINPFTKDSDASTRVAGSLLGAIAKGVLHHEIDDAAKSGLTKRSMNERITVSTHYEGPKTFVLNLNRINSNDPSIAYVFERTGFSTWKLAGIKAD